MIKKIFFSFLTLIFIVGAVFATQTMPATQTSMTKKSTAQTQTMNPMEKTSLKLYNTSFNVVSASSLGKMKTMNPGLNLNPSGGRLVLSDAPQTFALTEPSSSVGFYQDFVSGQFRVYVNTRNIGAFPATVGFALTNTTNQPIELYRIAKGIGVDPNQSVAGQKATGKLFMVMKKTFVKTLKPDESYFVGKKVKSGDFFSLIGDYVSLTPNKKPATLTVTTLAYSGNEPTSFIDLPIVKRTSGTQGTFPFFIRTGTVTYNTMNGEEFFALGTQKQTAINGDYIPGQNFFTGKTVTDRGNYGVVYNLNLIVKSMKPREVGIYLIPGSGSGRYITMFNMMKIVKSGFLSHEEAWKLAKVTVDGMAKIDLLTSLPIGSIGPMKIVFVPEGK